MSKRTPVARTRRLKSSSRRSGTPIAAAAFKARCLELMDRVRETREEYVVTKHGKPIAKLVPYDAPEKRRPFFGSMKGTVLHYDRPLDPIPGEWTPERGFPTGDDD